MSRANLVAVKRQDKNGKVVTKWVRPEGVKPPSYSNTHRRKHFQKIRLKALALFGDKCIRCGYSDSRALQIDHIKGGRGLTGTPLALDQHNWSGSVVKISENTAKGYGICLEDIESIELKPILSPGIGKLTLRFKKAVICCDKCDRHPCACYSDGFVSKAKLATWRDYALGFGIIMLVLGFAAGCIVGVTWH